MITLVEAKAIATDNLSRLIGPTAGRDARAIDEYAWRILREEFSAEHASEGERAS